MRENPNTCNQTQQQQHDLRQWGITLKILTHAFIAI